MFGVLYFYRNGINGIFKTRKKGELPTLTDSFYGVIWRLVLELFEMESALEIIIKDFFYLKKLLISCDAYLFDTNI